MKVGVRRDLRSQYCELGLKIRRLKNLRHLRSKTTLRDEQSLLHFVEYSKMFEISTPTELRVLRAQIIKNLEKNNLSSFHTPFKNQKFSCTEIFRVLRGKLNFMKKKVFNLFRHAFFRASNVSEVLLNFSLESSKI